MRRSARRAPRASALRTPAGTLASMLTLAEAARLLPGARLVGDPSTLIQRVHSDTPHARPPATCSSRLRGERFDAHDFLARRAGCRRGRPRSPSTAWRQPASPGLEVADTRVALGELAAAWRRLFALPLVAVTGSNGKTTVTQMIASIFRAWQGDAAFATARQLQQRHRRAADAAAPALARASHRVGRGRARHEPSGRDRARWRRSPRRRSRSSTTRSASTRSSWRASMRSRARTARRSTRSASDGVAVFPADDAHAPLWRTLAGNAAASIDLRARSPTPTSPAGALRSDDRWQRGDARTPAGDVERRAAASPAGTTSRNALAATAAALAAGCPLDAIVRGLDGVRRRCAAARRRSDFMRGAARVTLDRRHLQRQPRFGARRDRRARGAAGAALARARRHGRGRRPGPGVSPRGRRLRARARHRRALGRRRRRARARQRRSPARAHFDDVEALVAALRRRRRPCASVLVKGSRFMRMERVVAALDRPSLRETPHAA